jgi:hypothetical protein
MFIKKLPLSVNLEQARHDLDTVLDQASWIPHNQIGLTCREHATDIWKDAAGSLFDRVKMKRVAYEHDFKIWNVDSYTRQLVNELEEAEGFKCGRVRYMRLSPKTGLSLHVDETVRYHLVLQTNPTAFFACGIENKDELAHCFHIPADGNFYKVDTTVPHFVYNAGNEDRIHLVIA